jgi:Holliday junction resolvasome RuvABC DNA-binding subunit
MSIRSISRKAKDSKVWNAVFQWVTGYSAYSEPERVVVKKAMSANKDNELVDYLVKLGFTKKEAQEATGYALEEKPDEGLEAQVKCALAYLKPEK